jgi:hypothetical protein
MAGTAETSSAVPAPQKERNIVAGSGADEL